MKASKRMDKSLNMAEKVEPTCRLSEKLMLRRVAVRSISSSFVQFNDSSKCFDDRQRRCDDWSEWR